MDPLEINASYRQQQLLDDALDGALVRSLRAARSTTAGPTTATPTTAGFLQGVVRVIGRLRRGRPASAPRKASV